MIGCAKSALGQLLERNKIVLVVGVIISVKDQLGARNQSYRIEIANIRTSELFHAPPVCVRIDAGVRKIVQDLEDSQDQKANGCKTLLAVDDLEGLVVLGLHHQISHIVRGLSAGGDCALNVLPEIVPFIGRPTVVALKARNAIGQAVTE